MGNSDAWPLPSFTQFAPELADALQRCAETYLDEFDEHLAFDYLVAELFATTNPPRFTFTDGPNDGGVDFFVKEGPRYIIFQCKSCELAAPPGNGAPPSFNDQGIDDLISAVRMLKDPEGKYRISSKVRALRTDFQRDQQGDPEGKLLTAILAVAGVLTPSAKAKFTSEQAALRRVGVTLRLFTWEDIYRKLHFQELDVSQVKIELQCDDAKEALLRYQDYCYVLARAYSFYEAFRQHEWNLFDWNVRLQLTNSPINGKIVTTLQKQKTRKHFHHYNNGILITCNSYRVDEKRNIIRLLGAQIVNGCQTVRAICEAYEQLDPSDQKHFRDHAKTQVKIIRNTDPDFINELTITTNDQNPMNQRNLRSNTFEQKGIQNEFRGMRPAPWFYERKDGEFKSLLSATSGGRWFRKSDYAVEKGRFRKIGNEELAKCWFAATGNSDQVVRGGIDLFQDEHYIRIFKRSPNEAFWTAFAKSGNFEPNDDLFSDNTPSAYLYLLVFLLSQFIRARTLSTKQNKDFAIERGRKEGAIRGDSQADIDAFLAADPEYRLNIMRSNMKDILLELFMFALASKYQQIDALFASAILSSDDVQAYVTSSCLPDKAPSPVQNGSRVLGPTLEFLGYCTQQFFYANQAEILAAPRVKAYLWHRKVVTRMRDNVLKIDPMIRGYDATWKLRGKTFLESLPPLTDL